MEEEVASPGTLKREFSGSHPLGQKQAMTVKTISQENGESLCLKNSEFSYTSVLNNVFLPQSTLESSVLTLKGTLSLHHSFLPWIISLSFAHFPPA